MLREEVMGFMPTIPPRRRQGHPLRMHVGEKTGKFRIETQWIGQEISPELSRISKKNLGPSCC